MPRLHYRCSDKNNCGRRKMLNKLIEFYVRQPKCPGCGRHTLKIDPSVNRQNRKQTCYCKGIHYPHRRGTILSKDEWCHQLDMEEVQIQFDNEELGAVTSDPPEPGECPF